MTRQRLTSYQKLPLWVGEPSLCPQLTNNQWDTYLKLVDILDANGMKFSLARLETPKTALHVIERLANDVCFIVGEVDNPTLMWRCIEGFQETMITHHVRTNGKTFQGDFFLRMPVEEQIGHLLFATRRAWLNPPLPYIALWPASILHKD